MGYYSDVAICLRAKDAKVMYEKALQEFNDEVKDSNYVLDLLNDGYTFFNVTLTQPYSAKEKAEIAISDLKFRIEKQDEFVVFNFNWIKWYHDYCDVGWIIRNIRQFDYYEMVEIGEDNATNEERSEEGNEICNLGVRCELDIRV